MEVLLYYEIKLKIVIINYYILHLNLFFVIFERFTYTCNNKLHAKYT